MTTQVKVPVLDAPEVAIWLSTQPNALLSYINSVAMPVAGGGDVGKILTAISPGVTSYQNPIVPAPGAGVDRRAPIANTSGVITWGTTREVPLPVTPDEDDYALIANAGSFSWEDRHSHVIDQKVFAWASDNVVGSITNSLWVKPGTVRDTDWVVVTAVGGGGSGGVAWVGVNNGIAMGVRGGQGGGYMEWVFRASDLGAEMIASPGLGGLQVSQAHTGGTSDYGNTAGNPGTDSFFETRVKVGTDISSINLHPTNPLIIVTTTAHTLTTGDLVLFHAIADTGGPTAPYHTLNGGLYSVVVTGPSTFTLKDVRSAADKVIAPVGGTSYITNTGLVSKVFKNLLVAKAGIGGTTSVDSLNLPPVNGGSINGALVIQRGVNTSQFSDGVNYFSLPVLYCGGDGRTMYASGYADTIYPGSGAGSFHAGSGGNGTGGNPNQGSSGVFPGGGGGAGGSIDVAGPLIGGKGANGKVVVTVVRGEKPRGLFNQIV